MCTAVSLFEAVDQRFAEAVARRAFANPFGPARVLAERDALGPDYVDAGPLWTPWGNRAAHRENALRIRARLTPLIGRLRERLAAGAVASATDLVLYKEAGLYLLYDRYAARLRGCIEKNPAHVGFYGAFAADYAWLGNLPGVALQPAAQLFAFGFQIARAIHNISSSLLGGSPPAARLRVQVWESIFTHDLRRYLRTMYAHMDEISTLVLGPTGSGKEVVARTIGLSRYLPFDERKCHFPIDHKATFHGLNLSALAPSVIESELFGHKRGSFTGAVADKPGWLKLGGAMFIDEIGEIGESIQVKLLRVIQEHSFQPVGGTEDEPFDGKIIAATHRDLGERIREGAFRLDLYMRLCADRIQTPSLREMLDAAPEERRAFVRHITAKIGGPEEADQLTDEVEEWIHAKLPPDYPWDGNVRELEQCVRNRLVHNSCRPLDLAAALPPRGAAADGVSAAAAADGVSAAAAGVASDGAGATVDHDAFARAFREGELTIAEVIRRYMTILRALMDSDRDMARRLGIDRRTVAQLVDKALLARLVEQRDGESGRKKKKR